MDFGLALSGGGAKGAAHAGVLEAMRERGLQPKWISGTSSGSIVAALYAAGYTPLEIKKILSVYIVEKNGDACDCKYRCNRKTGGLIDVDYWGITCMIINRIFLRYSNFQGVLKGEKLLKILVKLFEDKGVYTFDDIKMPVIIPALDVASGESVYFSNMHISSNIVSDIPVAQAVMASCSFPVVFRPQKYKDYIFVDGGVLDNLPVGALRSIGAKKTVAVSFGSKTDDFAKLRHKSAINLADRCISIIRHKYEEITDTDIDFLLEVNIDNVSLLEVSRCMDCYQKGYEVFHRNYERMMRKL